MRDEFTASIKRILATRTGHLCSNPGCHRSTAGPGVTPDATVNIGVAAHITAASPGTTEVPAPRYDKTLTTQQRSDISNGIWLCQICAKLIDADVQRFSADLLQKWKKDAEERAFLAVATSVPTKNHLAEVFAQLDKADSQFLHGLALAKNEDIEAVTERMRQVARNDIAAFRGTNEWPANVIDLDLVLNVGGKQNAISLEGLANAISVTDGLSIISPPGTGKTTTIIQLADKIVHGGLVVPVIVPLGEWSGNRENVFSLLSRRNAFRSFREQHFQLLAFYGRLVVLVDGWNEVDADSRVYAIRQLNALRRDFPLLSVVIGTRRQAVPISGPVVEIEPLSETQQLEIALRFPGGSKETILDQACRTPGIRELIATPLYLNALLNSTQNGSFPQTKEEVLSAFVAQHESAPEKAEVLKKELLGFHKDMLIGIAVEANNLANTTLPDESARVAISKVESQLTSSGQITVSPQPSLVLDVLVNTHALVRSPSVAGSVSFQHQQFQEWYASFQVESLMLKAPRDGNAKKVLRTEVLNWIAWEESILFACERLSRKDANGVHAVAAAIMETLGIDPMLAAEMVYRSSDAVWSKAKDQVMRFASRWHKTGTVDRAVRFMITTGRPEFAPQIWPLVATSDDQVYFDTLRKPQRFRPSVLGPDAAKRLTELPDNMRRDIVAVIADESGFDGLELATQIAKHDRNPDVVVKIIHALEFRRADRHVFEILNTASEDVWERLASTGYRIHLKDAAHRTRLAKLMTAQNAEESETDPVRALFRLVNHPTIQDGVGKQIPGLIAAANFPANTEQGALAIEQAYQRFPDRTTTALLQRIQVGLPVPHRAYEFLKNVPVVDDGPFAAAALDKASPQVLADFAFTVIGPNTVGKIMDELFDLHDRLNIEGHKFDEPARKRYWRLVDAVLASRPSSFIAALLERAETSAPHRIQLMADLLSRHDKRQDDGVMLSGELRPALVKAVEQWINVVLTSPDTNRNQLAHVARAVGGLQLPQFTDALHKMLEKDLTDWARTREEWKKAPRGGHRPSDVSTSYTNQYCNAFAAIGGDVTIALMKSYLADLRFGIDAAVVLSTIWYRDNPSGKERQFGAWYNFSNVKGNRALRQNEKNPPVTSDSAEAIFAVVRELGTKENDPAAQRHAIQLATIGLRMSHGLKRAEIDSLLGLLLPFTDKKELLTAAAQAGETIRVQDLVAGVQELLEVAKKETWRLDKTYGELMGWIELFPFSDVPGTVVEILETLPEQHSSPWELDRLLIALADSPHDDALQVLKILAERDKRILDTYHWTNSVFRLGTEAAGRLIVDFICDGKLPGRDGFSTRNLTELAQLFPPIHSELLLRYAAMEPGKARSVLESILVELADAEIVLAFVRSHARHKEAFDWNLARAIRETAVGKRPVEDWPNAYQRFSVTLTGLRKMLFGMVLANSAESALAIASLNEIEELRDEHGRVNDEPRHPDIDSGQPWPKEAAF